MRIRSREKITTKTSVSSQLFNIYGCIFVTDSQIKITSTQNQLSPNADLSWDSLTGNLFLLFFFLLFLVRAHFATLQRARRRRYQLGDTLATLHTAKRIAYKTF